MNPDEGSQEAMQSWGLVGTGAVTPFSTSSSCFCLILSSVLGCVLRPPSASIPASLSPHESELLASRAQQDSGENSGQGTPTALRGWERLPSSSEELLTLHPTQDQRLDFKEMEALGSRLPCSRLPGSPFPLISQVCSLTLTQLGERPAKLSLQLVFEYPTTNNHLAILGSSLSRLSKPSHLIAVVFCFVCF